MRITNKEYLKFIEDFYYSPSWNPSYVSPKPLGVRTPTKLTAYERLGIVLHSGVYLACKKRLEEMFNSSTNTY